MIVVHTGAFFVGLNVLAWFLVEAAEDEGRLAHLFYHPHALLQKEPSVVRALYPELSDEAIVARLSPPDVVAHPVLEFMERPARGAVYNVGLENARYNEADAEPRLNGAVWVFGGSTVFGQGSADHETLVAAMARLDPTRSYVNFGVQGYNQNLEIQKLLLLLKKGYRPSEVIFLDGLNDMLSTLGSNFSPEETPMLAFNAYSHRFNIKNTVVDLQAGAVWHRSPLALWWKRRGWSSSPEEVNIAKGPTDVYDPESLYHRDPLLHFAKTGAFSGRFVHSSRYGEKLETYYRKNLAFIAKLAQGFGFEAHFYFQPLGPLNRRNPFIRDWKTYIESDYYETMSVLGARVRESLETGRLSPMRDLSRLDEDCPDCYVDLAHYSPAFNARIARAVLEARGRE